MRLFFLLIIILFATCVRAQQISTETLPVLQSPPYFDANFIKQHRVASIRATISFKDNMKPIERSPGRLEYVFDEQGLVKYYTRTSADSNRPYIIQERYFFDSVGKLQSTYSRGKGQRRIVRKAYNSHGQLTRVTVEWPETDKPIEISQFNYEYYTRYQYKQYALNDEGLTYKYTIVNLDTAGRISGTTSRYIRGAVKSETFFWRNKRGQVTEFRSETEAFGKSYIRYVLTYDSFGNLLTEDQYENENLVVHSEFLYKNGLIDAILKRNPTTGRITIIELDYLYF